MRINPISVNYQRSNKTTNRTVQNRASNVQFQGKHDCAKALGGICGSLGTLGALGGIALMTGGISLVPTIIYGATCGAIGAGFGHAIDKDVERKEREEREKKK